jgi:hypothetical protein
MSCAARYSETTSLKFILNPFEIFRTVKSRLMCRPKLSIFERLEDAIQRLTMIFPNWCKFQTGVSLPHIRRDQNRSPAPLPQYTISPEFCRFCGVSQTNPALRRPQRFFIKRISAASVHNASLRFVRDLAERSVTWLL